MLRLTTFAALLTGCTPTVPTSPPVPDGWTALPKGAAVRAAGRHADGTLWFAGSLSGQAWVLHVRPDGTRVEGSPALGYVMDAGAAPGGDLWVSSAEERALRLARLARDGRIREEFSTPEFNRGQTYDLVTVGAAAVAIGMQSPMASGLTYAWLLGAGADGGALLDHRLGTIGYSWFAGGAALPDGRVAAVGQVDRHAALVLATPEAVVTLPVLAEEGEHVRVHDVAALDGDVVVLGNRVDAETSEGFLGTVLAQRIAADGTIRWSTASELVVADIGEAIPTASGVAALATTASNPSGKLWLLEVDPSGTISTRPLDGPAMSSRIDLTAFLARRADGGPELIQVQPGTSPRYRVLAF